MTGPMDLALARLVTNGFKTLCGSLGCCMLFLSFQLNVPNMRVASAAFFFLLIAVLMQLFMEKGN